MNDHSIDLSAPWSGDRDRLSQEHRERQRLPTAIPLILVVLPITSFLVLPSVPGTTPASLLTYLLLFPLTGFLILGRESYTRIAVRLLVIFYLLFLGFVISRYSYIYANVPSLHKLNLVNPTFVLPYVMTSNITQAMYLLAGVFIYCLAAERYEPSWDRWIFIGAWLLLAYGYIDWAAQSFLGLNVDFLSNRVFDAGRFEVPGSLRQNMTVFGFHLLRFKSFTGEPSMFAITAIPYLYLAVVRRRNYLAGALVVAMLLSFSTTAYAGLLGMACFLLAKIKFERSFWLILTAGIIATVGLYLKADQVYDLVSQVFVSKLSGDSASGHARSGLMLLHLTYWSEAPWLVKIFGLGFGTVRSTDLLSSLLVNIGLFGMLLLVGWQVHLLIHAGRGSKAFGVYVALVLLLLMMVAVPEFAYLPPWLLAGLLASQKFKETPNAEA